MQAPSVRERAALALLLVAVMIGLTIWVHRVNAALPFVVDEVIYLWEAEQLAAGRITAPEPPFPQFVWCPLLPSRDGQRFGKYPIGFPLALAPWAAAGIPWALNVLLAAVSLLLLYMFCRRLDGPVVAWVAVLLTALSPFFIVQSTITMTHPLTLVLTLWLLLALERYGRPSGGSAAALQAGTAIGYAVHVAPLIAVPLGIVCAERGLTRARERSIPRRDLIAFAAPVVAGVALFCFVNARTTGNPWEPGYFYAGSERMGFGESLGRGGFFPPDALRNTWDRFVLLNEFLFGWPIPSLSFAGLYLAAWSMRSRTPRSLAGLAAHEAGVGREERDRWHRPLLLLFVTTLIAYAFWHYAGTQKSLGPRFLYFTIPGLVLFSARGIVAVARLVPDRSVPRGAGPRRGLIAMAVVVGLLTLSGTAPYVERLTHASASRWRRAARSLLEELDRRGIDRGTLFVESTMFNRLACLQYQSRFLTEAPRVFVQDRNAPENARLLQARNGIPAYYLEPTREYRWIIHEMPARQRAGSAAPGSAEEPPAD